MKSRHHFSSAAEEERLLIYNFLPVYGGSSAIFVQNYYFDWRTLNLFLSPRAQDPTPSHIGTAWTLSAINMTRQTTVLCCFYQKTLVMGHLQTQFLVLAPSERPRCNLKEPWKPWYWLGYLQTNLLLVWVSECCRCRHPKLWPCFWDCNV